MYLSPAEYVIHIFRGVRKTARAIGRDPSSIVRWKRPKSVKGTGGLIPTHARQLILDKAKEWNLDITSHDLDYGRDLPNGLSNGEKYQHQEIDRPAGEILP